MMGFCFDLERGRRGERQDAEKGGYETGNRGIIQ